MRQQRRNAKCSTHLENESDGMSVVVYFPLLRTKEIPLFRTGNCNGLLHLHDMDSDFVQFTIDLVT